MSTLRSGSRKVTIFDSSSSVCRSALTPPIQGRRKGVGERRRGRCPAMHMERQVPEVRFRSSLTLGPSLEGRGSAGMSSAVAPTVGYRDVDADGGDDMDALLWLADPDAVNEFEHDAESTSCTAT